MAKTRILLAHGAGAPTAHPWLKSWAERLGTLGQVTPFDYPYMREGRRMPDRLPKLIEAHREALEGARAGARGPLVLAGKSMGSRVGCHLSLEESVSAVVCFGYPLRSSGKRQTLRDQVLLQMTTPVLFIQGTRDPICPLELLEPVRESMTAPNQLHVVEAGDHSLLVTKTQLKKDSETQDDVDQRILGVIQSFLEEHS